MADTIEKTPDQKDSRLAGMGNAERYWTWKAGLRAVVLIINVIAIGCAAGTISRAQALNKASSWYDYSEVPDWQIGALITLSASFVWCLLCIVIPLVLKPPRPLHPGIAVGIDLVFWLGFVVIGLFTVAAVYGIAQFGSYGNINDPSTSTTYYGEYFQAPNGTWIYKVENIFGSSNNALNNGDTGDNQDVTSANISAVVRDCTPKFTNCAEQDAFVNQVWKEKPRLFALSVLVNVVEWLDLIIHFIVFVWACVDTHRYNRRSSVRKEQIVADRIIADLESKGLIKVKDGVVQPVSSGQLEMLQDECQHAK